MSIKNIFSYNEASSYKHKQKPESNQAILTQNSFMIPTQQKSLQHDKITWTQLPKCYKMSKKGRKKTEAYSNILKRIIHQGWWNEEEEEWCPHCYTLTSLQQPHQRSKPLSKDSPKNKGWGGGGRERMGTPP